MASAGQHNRDAFGHSKCCLRLLFALALHGVLHHAFNRMHECAQAAHATAQRVLLSDALNEAEVRSAITASHSTVFANGPQYRLCPVCGVVAV